MLIILLIIIIIMRLDQTKLSLQFRITKHSTLIEKKTTSKL